MPGKAKRPADVERPAEQEVSPDVERGAVQTLPVVPDRNEPSLGENTGLVQEMPYQQVDARTAAGNPAPVVAERADGTYTRRFSITLSKWWEWSDSGDYEQTLFETARVTTAQDALNAGYRLQAVPEVEVVKHERVVELVCTAPVVPTGTDDQEHPLSPGGLLQEMGGTSVVGSAASGSDAPDPSPDAPSSFDREHEATRKT